jgi:hypothetical protein
VAKRGPKPTPNRLKVLRGTFKAQTAHDAVVAELPGTLGDPPAWLSPSARQLWADHAATYERRGQSVVGCEAALAQYVALEDQLIATRRKRRPVSAGIMTAFRMFASEFFDTPASQVGRGKTATPSNRFTHNAAAGPATKR